MRYVFWLLGLAVVLLAVSIPVTARAAELAPPQVGSYERGLAALEAGNTDEALAHLRAVSARSPHHTEALRTIGLRLLAAERGDARGAIPYVNTALLADPFEGASWRAWARLHLELLGLQTSAEPGL